MTLFGKSRLNENSVEAFFRCNAFSTHRKCVEEHFQCVLKHCECVSTEAKCIAYPFKKHFQNVFNALANTDNAFNKTAFGIIHGTSTAAIRYYEIFTMNCYLLTSEL